MVHQSASYNWIPQTLSDARLIKRNPRRRKNHEDIKVLIDGVKDLLKKAHNGEEKRELAKAGLCLNKILMK